MMSDEEVARMALVHVTVLEREAPAIYVARRDAATLFIGGPDFTDDDPSCFRWVPLAAALEVDASLTDVARLAVGRCAWRSDRSEPWAIGVVPTGPTFLVTYEARPDESNAERDNLGGAFANCWVVTDTLEAAVRIAADHLAENGWVIVERTGADTATPEDHETNSYFRQAQVDGLVVVFHRFPKQEDELN
jgi:hypothetical protein